MSSVNRFKLISKKDVQTLHKHYLNFEPYSDFNLVSIWGYMVPGTRYIYSKGAVLYEMIDYKNGQKYLTAFGDDSVKQALKQLAKKSSTPQLVLHHVPESTCLAIADWDALDAIDTDESNHDYIFSVLNIANLNSEHLIHKRKSLTKLVKQHPNLKVKVIDHRLPENRRQIYSLFRQWIKQSGSNDWKREYHAIQRVLKMEGFRIICIGAYDKKKLVGFTVNEIEKNGYYQGHYGKTNYNYPGLGLYLEHETAKYILKHYKSKYINLQQDMGIEGLRYYKSSLDPIKKLKKYNLTINTERARA